MKSNQKQELLIVFTRYPEPGKAKTRLAHALGDHGSADIQKKLTEDTLSKVRKFQQAYAVDIKVYYTGSDLQRMKNWLGPGFSFQSQGKGDLGDRLAEACSSAFRQGYKRLVIIGSDCPDLAPTHFEQAFAALYDKDLVLGPAADGGYYLIGLNGEYNSLFTGIPWGSGAVLEQTLNNAEKLGLAIATLETLSDVDRPEDLKHINHHSHS